MECNPHLEGWRLEGRAGWEARGILGGSAFGWLKFENQA